MNRLLFILFCIAVASCSSHCYTVKNIAGEYHHSSRVTPTGEGMSSHLWLEENGTCSLEKRLCISNSSAVGIWYVRNDSVICRFGGYAGPEYPFNTLRIDGEMSFGIHNKKLKNKKYVFSKQKSSARNERRAALLFTLENGILNALYGVPELATERNMIDDTCEIQSIAKAIGDCDSNGNMKEGYGNWFRYYNIPSPPDYRLILRTDDESLEEYILYTDECNRLVAIIVAREYGDGADFETLESQYKNDTIHSTRITGHYIVDGAEDTITGSLPAVCDTLSSSRPFRTYRPIYLCEGQSALDWSKEAFTIHPKGKAINCYTKGSDNSYKDVIFKLYPLKEEHNAGHIVEYSHSTDGYLSIIVNNDIVYVKKGSIAVNTRNYQGSTLNLYSAPNENSPILYRIDQEQTAPIFDICGSWVYVKMKDSNGKDVYGWLEPEMQCGNPFTNCP